MITSGNSTLPVYGYDVRLLGEATGKEVPAGPKGVLVIEPPLPPGCGTTILGDDQRFIQTTIENPSALEHIRKALRGN